MKRSTPLTRTGFKRKQFAPPLAYDQGDMGEVRAAAVTHCKPLHRGVYAKASNDATPVPKGVKAKPGKRKPNAREREWMDAIVAFGCVACWFDGRGRVAPCVHHILRGGQRMGHLFTIPLCEPGHHQHGGPLGLVSRHPWKARFEQQYGSEFTLLRHVQKMLLAKLSFDPREFT
jgi:hypothetical protein